jgi:hypothetical protein
MSETTKIEPGSFIVIKAKDGLPLYLRLSLSNNTKVNYTILDKYSQELYKEEWAASIDLSGVPKNTDSIIIRIDSVYNTENPEHPTSASVLLSSDGENDIVGYIWYTTKKTEAKHRDKYIKVKVRYTG